jgi:chromosome segregation ATPase
MIPKDLDFYPHEWQKLTEEQLQRLREEIAKGRSKKSDIYILKSMSDSRVVEDRQINVIADINEQEKSIVSKSFDTNHLLAELRLLKEENEKILAAADARIQAGQERVQSEKVMIVSLGDRIKAANRHLDQLQDEKRLKQRELESALELRSVVEDAWRAQNLSEDTPTDAELNVLLDRFTDMTKTLKQLSDENADLQSTLHLQNAELKRVPTIFASEQVQSQNRIDQAQTKLSFLKEADLGAAESLKRLTEEEERLKEKLSGLDTSIRHILSKSADACILPYRQKTLRAANKPTASADDILSVLTSRFKDLQVLMEETRSFSIKTSKMEAPRPENTGQVREVQIIRTFEEDPIDKK